MRIVTNLTSCISILLESEAELTSKEKTFIKTHPKIDEKMNNEQFLIKKSKLELSLLENKREVSYE